MGDFGGVEKRVLEGLAAGGEVESYQGVAGVSGWLVSTVPRARVILVLERTPVVEVG